MNDLILKYSDRLKTVKENRALLPETATDAVNTHYDQTIRIYAEIVRDLKALSPLPEIVKSHICACGSKKFHKKHIKEGKMLGTNLEYDRNDPRIRSSEFSLGWDYYARVPLLRTICKECGQIEYQML